MLKLISLNMEGEIHLARVLPLLESEQADVICLMEAPMLFQHHLHKLGYFTSFSPMLIRERKNVTHPEGVIFASRPPHTFREEYYYGSREMISVYQGKEEAVANPLCIGTVEHQQQTYVIATTHVMVTPHGETNEHQRNGITKLLNLTNLLPPHVICGDFNMPRGHNEMYEEVTQNYTDTIPSKYTSSLDPNIHRLGSDPNLKDPIFDKFMVDYIFTKEPYTASDVRLEFGVSDHAAVIANIERTT